MQKTYWWRICTLFLGGGLTFTGVIYENYFCFAYNNQCPFDSLRLTVLEPIMFLSLSLLAVSFFLFFIRDDVFLRWFRFAVIWFVVSAVFIFLSPVSSGGWGANLNPTKESVSIWMSSLFVIVSLAKIIWDTRKSKAVV